MSVTILRFSLSFSFPFAFSLSLSLLRQSRGQKETLVKSKTARSWRSLFVEVLQRRRRANEPSLSFFFLRFVFHSSSTIRRSPFLTSTFALPFILFVLSVRPFRTVRSSFLFCVRGKSFSSFPSYTVSFCFSFFPLITVTFPANLLLPLLIRRLYIILSVPSIVIF